MQGYPPPPNKTNEKKIKEKKKEKEIVSTELELILFGFIAQSRRGWNPTAAPLKYTLF